MSRRAQAARRRWFAVTTAVLWLLGVEVLPNLHLGHHRDDHTHTASGAIVTVSFDETSAVHRHADGSVHADHDRAAIDHADALEAPHAHPRRHRAPTQTTLGAPDHLPHSATGLGHRAVALHPPAAPLTVPLSAPGAAPYRLEGSSGIASAIAPLAPTARGPPTA